jgi:Ferritin-like
VRKSSSVKVTR